MADREDAFTQLLERQPTDGDRQRLYRARDTLNIKPTDAVWRLLMVLEHYQTMYERIPHQIADASRNATETIRVTAEAQAKAAREETKKGLMKAVTEAVQATAKQFARAEHFKWVSVAVSIVSITVLAVGWGENRRGQAQGFAAGESSAKAECAYATKLSTWALTPDGVRAYQLEKLGSLHDLVSCSGRGLDRKGDWCVAQPERGKSYRWRIAAGEPDR
jgi:hypothetical protein